MISLPSVLDKFRDCLTQSNILMQPETFIRNSRSTIGAIGLLLSLVVAISGGFAAQSNRLGYVILAGGVFGVVAFIAGFVRPIETGCTVDDIKISWWTTWPKKSNQILLSDITDAQRTSLESSWIEIVTRDGVTHIISDYYTGESDRIFNSLASRLKSP